MRAVDVANFILSLSKPEDHDVTNMKLQKLLYFAQGLHLALFDRQLFDDEIQAWKYGPVVPSVYEAFSSRGGRIIPIPKNFVASEIPEKCRKFLTDVTVVYGQYSAAKLSQITHSEGPWKASKDWYRTIEVSDLKDYFQSVKERFIDDLEEIMDQQAVLDRKNAEHSLIPAAAFWKSLGH